jgi:hypothetical protein
MNVPFDGVLFSVFFGFGGATLATAGNLVFHNSMAYNAETGEKRWEIDLNEECGSSEVYARREALRLAPKP